jgi:hypothetical protein
VVPWKIIRPTFVVFVVLAHPGWCDAARDMIAGALVGGTVLLLSGGLLSVGQCLCLASLLGLVSGTGLVLCVARVHAVVSVGF